MTGLRSITVGRFWLVAAAVLVGLTIPQSALAAFGPLEQQFRISFMGPDGDPAYGAGSPSVVYNPNADEYLAVWVGVAPPVDDEVDIFTQRLSGGGAPLGAPVRVSEQGTDGDPDSGAVAPTVAYNPTADEYLVAWQDAPGVGTEVEIWAQRLSTAGAEVGTDIRISHMGPDGQAYYFADSPSVISNPRANEYLVVWYGRDDTPPGNEDYQVFGQRVSAAGAPVGGRIQISTADQAFLNDPTVAYHPTADEYLVAWQDQTYRGSPYYRVSARRLSAAGDRLGDSEDLRVSGCCAFGGIGITANPTANEYLVVWYGTLGIPPGYTGAWGQRLTATGAETGVDDFRISEGGALETHVAYDPAADDYVVVFYAVPSDIPQIFGRRLTGAGAPTGSGDFRISDHLSGDSNAYGPSVAANPAAGEYFVVWTADEDNPVYANDDFVDQEFEVFGRLLGLLPPTLVTTDPASPARDRNPRLKGSVDPEVTIDVFKNSNCAGEPGVNDDPGDDLNGAGIAVPVAEDTITELSATASSGGRTSRCSNSISYTEGPAFGDRARVRLRLAARRIAPSDRLQVRIRNRNDFRITGKLSGRTLSKVSVSTRRRVRLRPREFRVGADARKTVKLNLPRPVRGALGRRGRLRLGLTAKVESPLGNTRTVRKRVTVRLKG